MLYADALIVTRLIVSRRNNSLCDLEFEVYGLSKAIDEAQLVGCEAKGVTTRVGKSITEPIGDNTNNNKHPLPHHDKPTNLDETSTKIKPKNNQERPNELQQSSIPFPYILRKEKEEDQQRNFLENLKQLHINIPFTEALAQMPKYAKFLKGLRSNKARLEEACTVPMNERCFAVLLNKLPSKEKDPGSFTILCNIKHLHIDNALADLEASISLMPYTMYENLGLGEPKPKRMSLELADRSIQYPRGITEDVLIKIDKLVLPIDFVILDMREDFRILIILGKPFLATARAMIDVFNKKIILRVGNEEADEEPTNCALMAYASSGSLSSLGSDNECEHLPVGPDHLAAAVELSPTSHPGLGVSSSGLFRGGVSASRIPALRLVDGVDRALSALGLRGQIRGDKNPGGRRYVCASSSAGTKSSGCSNSGTNTDWTSDSEDEYKIESVPDKKKPSLVQTYEHVKTARTSVKEVKHPKQAENHKIDNPKSRAVLTRSGLVTLNAARPVSTAVPQTTVKSPRPVKHGNPQQALKDKCVVDSGCSRHMTGNISFLSDFEEFNGGYVSFGGNPKGGKISGKCKIKTGKLDFDDVYFVKELKFNIISVSQMCDKKNNVLFIDTAWVVLSSDFKLLDENQVLLRVPRENNMYNVDLKNVV
nr:hypothetical protein [Tanacetum cinerariifolium]